MNYRLSDIHAFVKLFRELFSIVADGMEVVVLIINGYKVPFFIKYIQIDPLAFLAIV